MVFTLCLVNRLKTRSRLRLCIDFSGPLHFKRVNSSSRFIQISALKPNLPSPEYRTF